ncbi:MAG TPA: hypothetical protein V6D08_02715, partial [Candidatus Obscuribacterales bacterium]
CQPIRLPMMISPAKLPSFLAAFALVWALVNGCPGGVLAQGQVGAKPPVLKGGVRGAVLLTEDGLIKIGEAAEDLRKSCLLVISEVTRKDTVTVKPPNVLPNSVVIPAVPDPSGTIQMGPLEPRKKYLDRFVSDVAYNVELLQNSVDALIIPDNKVDSVARPWGNLRGAMQDVQKHFAQLKSLTEGPKYDNEKIARQALAIYDSMSTVKKLRNEVLRIVRVN